MVSRRKPKGPNFILETIPPMSEEQKDELFVHLIRRPRIFNEALSRLPNTLMNDESDNHRLIVEACHRLADTSGFKPNSKKFKRQLKNQVLKIAEGQFENEQLMEAAKELAGQGGFIEKAFEVDKAELSEEIGCGLLKRFLYERTIASPLDTVMRHSRIDNQVPKNIPDVIEKLSERMKSLESIDSKAIKTIGEEWKEHNARLKIFRGRTMVGLKTGMPEFDRRTLGLRGVFVLGAKPGAGKSTLSCVQIAVGVCRHHADNDCVVVVVSLDMDRFDLYTRTHCHLADMDWIPLMFGDSPDVRGDGSMFSEEHQECLEQAKNNLEDLEVGTRLAIFDRQFLGDDITSQRLASLVRAVKAKVKAKRALLVIDYLQLLPVPDEVTERGDLAADKYRVRMIQKVIENTKTTTDPIGDTALLISEARKPPTAKDGWGDSMSELMGSARLGYAGDAVVLYREMSNKEIQQHYGMPDKDAAEKRREALKEQGIAPIMLILEKGRDGMMRGKWGVEFHFRKSVFHEITPGSRCPPRRAPARSADSEEDDDDDKDGQDAGAEDGVPASNGTLALPPRGPGCRAKAKKKKKNGSHKMKASTGAKTKNVTSKVGKRTK